MEHPRAAQQESDRIAALVQRAGARVTYAGDVRIGNVSYPDLRVECRDNEHAIEILNLLARDDADHRVKCQALAHQIGTWARQATHIAGLHGAPHASARAAAAQKIHRLVRDSIQYVDDPEQVFRSSDTTLTLGVGNCVNTARLVTALSLASGIPAKVVAVRPHGKEITHCVAQMHHDGRWHWAESTFPAEYDEEPVAGAQARGLLRKDLESSPCCRRCGA